MATAGSDPFQKPVRNVRTGISHPNPFRVRVGSGVLVRNGHDGPGCDEGPSHEQDKRQTETDLSHTRIERGGGGTDVAAAWYGTRDGDVVETPDEALASEVALNEKDEEAREARRVREREAAKPQ